MYNRGEKDRFPTFKITPPKGSFCENNIFVCYGYFSVARFFCIIIVKQMKTKKY